MTRKSVQTAVWMMLNVMCQVVIARNLQLANSNAITNPHPILALLRDYVQQYH